MEPQLVIDALSARPAARRYSRCASPDPVVGGFVRDVLLGRDPREVDLVVEETCVRWPSRSAAT